MEPDLANNVDAYVPLTGKSLEDVIAQLRTEVIKAIRDLQRAGLVGWFSFLLHHRGNMPERNPPVPLGLHFHMRMSPVAGVPPSKLIASLPPHFKQPIIDPLGGISNVNESLLAGKNWINGWKVVGASAEWVATLIESHAGPIPTDQIFQFIHFTTNALAVDRCIFLPGGFQQF